METLLNSIKKIDFLSNVFYGNTILDYIIFVVLFLIILILLKPTIKIILKLLSKIASQTPTNLDNKLVNYFTRKHNKTLLPLEVSIAFFIAISTLVLSGSVQKIVSSAAVILITIFLVTMIVDVIKYIIHYKYETADDPRASSLLLLFPVIKIFIWIFALLFIISNLGYNVTQLLAGLGIGGIAIALASQSFLGDLIAFVSIASDKPIEIGDYISVNGVEGTVKKIGIKSVRIERNMGEEVVIPNSTITGTELHNYRRLNKRRFDICINVALNTPNEKLQLIPQIASDICNNSSLLEFVRASLTNIGEFAYEFTIAVYVLDKDALIMFKEKEQFIYKLRTELNKEQIFFALPAMEIKQ